MLAYGFRVPTIDFIFFDAGGGHRAAANALKAVIEQQNRPWNVRLVNLQEVLDELDVFRKLTGVRLQDHYNQLLKKGWTLGSAELLKIVHLVVRLYHRAGIRILRRHWSETKPDLVVSLVPNFNRLMFEALRQELPRVPMVTILTDIADYPPHFWIERQDQHLVTGSDRAYHQALKAGYPPERVFRASGMILRPSFYELITTDRAAERSKLGLDPGVPTGVVLFGGEGSAAMLTIASQLSSSNLNLQLIMLCGRNAKLAGRLRAMNSRLKMHIEGFTSAVPHFMHLADFLIGKPGPGSISEAIAMKLPVIIERNIWTLPQERYNTEWVGEKGAGIVVRNFREIVPAVAKMLSPGELERFQANVAAIQNRAIFEIPEFLSTLLPSPVAPAHAAID